jgi:hypothetical protein
MEPLACHPASGWLRTLFRRILDRADVHGAMSGRSANRIAKPF